jgi:hypothetical protein
MPDLTTRGSPIPEVWMTNGARITQLEVTRHGHSCLPTGHPRGADTQPLLKLFKPMGTLIRLMPDDHDLLSDR